MPKAYSYLRFSTPEQSKGDSLRRQSKASEDYAKDHNLILDTKLNLNDEGISAYRGKNLETGGGLALFLEAIRANVVKDGDYLLVESLDRLSRATPRKALRVLEDIIDAGVTVVTLIDGKQYTTKSLDDDAFGLMGSIMIMTRANEESKTKAKRISEAWVSKRQSALDKPLTAVVPKWMFLDKSDSKIKLIEERALIVQRVFADYINGKGCEIIAQELNSEAVPVFGNGTRWHKSYISKILTNTACIGEYIPRKNTDISGKLVRVPLTPIQNYYPQVVSTQTFRDAQSHRSSMKRDEKPIGGKPTIHNLLSRLARCPICDSTMTRINKGEKWVYFLCTKAKAKAGCHYTTVNFDMVNQGLLGAVRELYQDKPSLSISESQIRKAIETKEVELDASYDKLENLLTLAEKGGSTSILERIMEIETYIKESNVELDSLREMRRKLDNTILDKRLDDLIDASQANPLDKTKLNAVLLSLFNKIVIEYREGVLLFHWKEGSHVSTVPYDYFHSSS